MDTSSKLSITPGGGIRGERRLTWAGEEKANRKKIMNQYSPQSPELWDLAGPLRKT